MRIKPLKTLLLAGIAGSLSLASVTAQARATDADKSFLSQDVQGARYELALAKLGMTKASKRPMREYARMVVHDHTQADRALMRLARSEGVDVPNGMTSDDEMMLAKLKMVMGNKFDRMFVDEMIRINTDDKKSASQEKMSTNERSIKSYISHFAAMDAKHKRMAMQLRSVV